MLAYNLQLAWISLRQTPGLTLLAIAAIAIGLGVLMTIQTQSRHMRSLPIGPVSENIYLVQMDNRDLNAPSLDQSFEMPSLSFRDAMYLLNTDTPAIDATTTWKTRGIITTTGQEYNPVRGIAVATNSGFFSIFNVPFLYGNGWTADSDTQGNAVVVISNRLNRTLFGDEDSVGRQITIIDKQATIVGVLDEWPITSQFYDRSFFRGFSDDIFLPQSFAISMNLPRYTRIECQAADRPRTRAYQLADVRHVINSECAWVNLWVKLETEDSVENYKSLMENYVSEQKALGRFPREQNNFLDNIVTHQNAFLSRDARFKFYQRLSWFFAGVCLLNAILILLAKFIRKTKEVALRRALGAKRNVLLVQYLIELVVIGAIGALAGLALSYLGLQGMLGVYMYGTDYEYPLSTVEQLYQMDWQLIRDALLIGILSTIVAGLYPIWKVCNVAPAPLLKTE